MAHDECELRLISPLEHYGVVLARIKNDRTPSSHLHPMIVRKRVSNLEAMRWQVKTCENSMMVTEILAAW
jgi:hypothetical protein